MSFHVPNKFRMRAGRLASDDSYGNNGAFIIRSGVGQTLIVFCIASDGEGWEHVSASVLVEEKRCPTWEEMCHIKSIFWDREDVVLQIHPRASEYVNFAQHTLHLWRQAGIDSATPPQIMVGPNSLPGAGNA